MRFIFILILIVPIVIIAGTFLLHDAYPAVSTVSAKDIGLSDEVKLTVPVSQEQSVTRLEFIDVFGDGTKKSVLDVREGAVIVAPFDAFVVGVDTYPENPLVGAGAIAITLQNRLSGDTVTLSLPEGTQVRVAKGAELNRNDEVAIYNGGSLGGKAAPHKVIIDFYSVSSEQYGLDPRSNWVSDRPSVVEN